MRLFNLFRKEESLYFPGCMAYFKYEKEIDKYRRIFGKLGIRVKVLDRKRCSGLELWESGYDFELRKVIRENFEIFQEENVKSILTTSPGCYKMFLKDYPKILPYFDVEIKEVWELVLEKLRKKPSLIRENHETITYHDPCYLGRYCEIYDAPREILRFLGYEIKEMDNTRENSFCCGSCGGLPRVSSKLADEVARERILQAKRIGVNKMVVVGFDNYDILKRNSENSGVEIVEMGEVLSLALGVSSLNEEEVFEDDLLEDNLEDEVEVEAQK